MVALRCSDLSVARACDEAQLELLDTRTAKRVAPVDLGFLNQALRPPLFQLLAVSLPRARPASRQASRAERRQKTQANERSSASDRLCYRPRIVIDGCVVVARRRWAGPGSVLPVPSAAESESRYALRVREWRSDNGIPEQVYVRTHVTGSTGLEDAAQGDGSASGYEDSGLHGDSETAESRSNDVEREPRAREMRKRNSRKPQTAWTLQCCTLLLRLFGRLAIGSANVEVGIEEVYPQADARIQHPTGAYVSECIFQFEKNP